MTRNVARMSGESGETEYTYLEENGKRRTEMLDSTVWEVPMRNN